MKLSDLIKSRFEASEFSSVGSLAVYANQTQPFVDAFVNGTKASREKEDILFEELTKGITVEHFEDAIKSKTDEKYKIFKKITENVSQEELIAAIELINVVRLNEIERNQFL